MPATYRVILSRRAFADLHQLLDFIQAQSPQGAAKTIDYIWKSAHSLEELPTRHRIFQIGKGVRPHTYVMPVGNYLIYYRVLEPQKLVRILTVRHGARRQPRKFD